MDTSISVPYTEKITMPLELFQSLPVNQSDKLQAELMSIYYKKNPSILQDITAVSGGDQLILETKKEQKFENVINKDYAFEVDVLRNRDDDDIAKALVRAIDQYNSQIDMR